MTVSAHDKEHSSQRRWLRFGTLLPLAIFLAIAGLFAFALSSGDPSNIPSVLIGKPAPDMEMPPLQGLTRNGEQVPSFRAADLKTTGQVSVVNFWASWCGPCIVEHPLLIELAEQTGLVLYGVNYKDPKGGGVKFLERLGNPFTAVGVDDTGRVAIEWGVYGMPETFIVDDQGQIVYKHVGPISREDLKATIFPIIEKARRQS